MAVGADGALQDSQAPGTMMHEDKIYQRIGEFVVSFQWLEGRIREIGWLILDPARKNWPPMELRNDTAAALFAKVEELFLSALPKCRLDPELEADFRSSFAESAIRFHSLRRARNKVLHSAYIEIKGGGEVRGLIRTNPRLDIDGETGELLFNHEMLSEKSFEREFKEMADLAVFFNKCYIQLIHRFPDGELVPEHNYEGKAGQVPGVALAASSDEEASRLQGVERATHPSRADGKLAR
jgi:hypothetical protein